MYSKFGNFGLQNIAILFKCNGKKLFFNLKISILQMSKKKNLKFGGHVDIQVRYKILQLEVPKRVLVLKNLTCFEEGLF